MDTPLGPGSFRQAELGGGHQPTTSERMYGRMLRIYPAEFRTRYRDEMVVLFGDQLRDARDRRGTGAVALTWIRSLTDLARSAVGEHLRKDRTMAHSLTTFEPTRSMRLLGLFGILGAVLLLWAFVSFTPFQDAGMNRLRLMAFALAGAAISLAFYRRLAAAAPTLALLTTAAVVIAGIWYAAWLVLAERVDRPFLGTFGFVNLLANIALWVTPAIWAIAALHTGAAWSGMSRASALATKAGLWVLIGSVVAWLGDDRLHIVDSLWGELWQLVALAGVAMNGIGWLTLGAVLLFGRARSEPGPA